MSQLILTIDSITGYANQECGHQRFRVHYQELYRAFKKEGATPGIQRVINVLLRSLKKPQDLSNEIIAERSLTSVATVKRAKTFLIQKGMLKVEFQGVKKVCKLSINWQQFIDFICEKKIRNTFCSGKSDFVQKNAATQTQDVEIVLDICSMAQDEPKLDINNIKLGADT